MHTFLKHLKKCQHMTFMMTPSNDNKSDICQFFLSILIPYCQYSICTKFNVKLTKTFWDIACFFTKGLVALPPLPPLRFSRKPSPGRVNEMKDWCFLWKSEFRWSPITVNILNKSITYLLSSDIAIAEVKNQELSFTWGLNRWKRLYYSRMA